MMKFLENDKIRLRAIEPEDLAVIYKWENDTSIWEYGNTIVPISKFALKQYIENAHKDISELRQVQLIIEEIETQNPVGMLNLFNLDLIHLRVELGMLIYHKIDRRRGFASSAIDLISSYCFNVLMLHQVYCSVDEDNIKSIKMLDKCGFERSGIKKHWRKTNSGWKNEILMQKINKKYDLP